MQIHRARVETRNFTFEAIGATPQAARDALAAGLAAHARQYRTAPGWANETAADASLDVLELGACYRDREAIA